MKITKFSARLRYCVEKGDFTTADLSYWFDRPYHTVWFWQHQDDRQPRGSPGQEKRIKRRLELLEFAVERKYGLPIPTDLNERERPKYIKNLRNDLHEIV